MDPYEEPAKKTPNPVPAAAALEMLQAVAEHRRLYGSVNYHLLRQRPEFAQWIGHATGETGRKRLNRMVAKVKRPLPPDRTKPHQGREVNDAQLEWAHRESARASAGENSAFPVSARQLMAGGAPTLEVLSTMGALLQQAIADVQCIREAAYRDSKTGHEGRVAADPDLALRAAREARALAKSLGEYQRFNTAIFREVEFSRGLVVIIAEETADDLARRDRLMTRLKELIHRLGGLPARQA